MFRSQRIHHQGALYSAWLKITGMVLWCPLTYTVNHARTQRVTICCHNNDLVHVNRHILVILAKHCTSLPDDGSSVIRNMLEQFLIFYNFNCIYILYIVHWLDSKVKVKQSNYRGFQEVAAPRLRDNGTGWW